MIRVCPLVVVCFLIFFSLSILERKAPHAREERKEVIRLFFLQQGCGRAEAAA